MKKYSQKWPFFPELQLNWQFIPVKLSLEYCDFWPLTNLAQEWLFEVHWVWNDNDGNFLTACAKQKRFLVWSHENLQTESEGCWAESQCCCSRWPPSRKDQGMLYVYIAAQIRWNACNCFLVCRTVTIFCRTWIFLWCQPIFIRFGLSSLGKSPGSSRGHPGVKP